MTDVSWDEIRKLRADFLSLQLTESSNKLSERNCVELINLLINQGLINVLFTTDGKDIITEQRLVREILDEIYVNGGRINSVELAKRLNIDLTYIENKVSDVCKEDPSLHFILGQFISVDYITRIAEEINDMLIERGLIPMNEVIRQYDLPTDYLHQIISNRVGTTIGARFESGVLYTDQFVRLQQSIIIGCLEGALLPLKLSDIIKYSKVNENLIQNLVLDLLRDGKIQGNLVGTTKDNSIFYPKVYLDAQSKYIKSFFTQNGYVEYSLVKNLGISDPEGQTKLVLKDQQKNLIYLPSGCVDLSSYLPQLEMNIEQGLTANEYIDITTIVPNSFTDVDIEKLLKADPTLSNQIESLGGQSISNTFLISRTLQEKIENKLQSLDEKYIEKELARCTTQMYTAVLQGTVTLASVSNQKATIKSGGKKAKGKSGATTTTAPKADDSNVNETISYVNKDDIIKQIKMINDELPDEIVDILADNAYTSHSRRFVELFIQRVKESFALKEEATGGSDGNELAKKKSGKAELKNLPDCLKILYNNICLFIRAIEFLNENEQALSDLLQRHLIRTLCTEVCDLLVHEVKKDDGKSQLTSQERTKIIQSMSEPNRTCLRNLNESLNGKNIEATFAQIEDAVDQILQLPLKKPNKKLEKELLLAHRQELRVLLENENDSATILHLTTTLLFYAVHGLIIHAPGKAVPMLIKHLSKGLPSSINRRLTDFQEFVIQQSSHRSKEGEMNETTMPQPDTDTVNFIKKLGMDAKENMIFDEEKRLQSQ